MPKQKRAKWFKRIAIISAVMAVAGLGTAWMMFQHIPDWYRPVQVPPEYEQAVRDDVTGTYDRLNRGLNESQRLFDHRFSQDQINAWLAMRERMWPYSRKWLPAAMSNPQIMIDREGFRLAVTYHDRGIRTVLNAQFQAHADRDGITLKLVRVAAGSLPMPHSQIRQLLAKIDAGAWPAGKRVDGQLQDCPLPALSDLFDGARFPNTWIWENGEKPFRITQLQFEPGELVVTFEPLPLQTSVWSGLMGRNSPGSAPAGSR